MSRRADTPATHAQAALESDLVAWGRVITLETRGRRSGISRQVRIGFVDEADGSLLIAARDENTHWALNLLAEPACRVVREEISEARTAVLLEHDDHDQAVRSLILKYGTPSEVLGAGPAFRLERAIADGSRAET